MPVTAVERNSLATKYTADAPYAALLSALTLGAAQAAGATSVTVDLSVATGDTLVFDQGTGTQETRTVTGVTGAGPYVASFTGGLTNARASGVLVSHLPSAAATVHELTGGVPAYARQSVTWAAPNAGQATGTAPAFNVPTGGKVGATALMSASTAGTYVDAAAVPCQAFTLQGTYTASLTYTQT